MSEKKEETGKEKPKATIPSCCADICREMMSGGLPEGCAVRMREMMSGGLPEGFAEHMREMMSRFTAPKKTEAPA